MPLVAAYTLRDPCSKLSTSCTQSPNIEINRHVSSAWVSNRNCANFVSDNTTALSDAANYDYDATPRPMSVRRSNVDRELVICHGLTMLDSVANLTTSLCCARDDAELLVTILRAISERAPSAQR